MFLLFFLGRMKWGDASEKALKCLAPIIKSPSRSVDGLGQNEILQGWARWDDAHPRVSA